MTKIRKVVLRDWLDWATMRERIDLANRSGTSPSYLVQLALGFRSASAGLAARIEAATTAMYSESKKRLPIIDRGDLCDACAECPYRKRRG